MHASFWRLDLPSIHTSAASVAIYAICRCSCCLGKGGDGRPPHTSGPQAPRQKVCRPLHLPLRLRSPSFLCPCQFGGFNKALCCHVVACIPPVVGASLPQSSHFPTLLDGATLASPHCLHACVQGKQYTVYLIKNTDNGRCYVGQTIQLLRCRFRQHMSHPNRRMQPDVRAVPEPDLVFSISALAITDSRSPANHLESRYI